MASETAYRIAGTINTGIVFESRLPMLQAAFILPLVTIVPT
jgi:hypothetical protein